MSNIAQRKWQAFKQNRRAKISAVILLVMLFVSAISELIANDKPLIIIKGDDNIQVDCNENTLTLSSNVDVNSFINIFCENSLGIIIPVLIRG